LQKSAERLRAQRSSSSASNGSKAHEVREASERGLSYERPRARKRRGLASGEGGRFVEAWRSTSRERSAIDECSVGSFALCAGELHEADADGRHLGLGKRTPFTRPSRTLSWRLSSFSVGALSAPTLMSPKEATEVPEARVRARAVEENAIA